MATTTYQAAIQAGDRSPPRPGDVVDIAEGAPGTITGPGRNQGYYVIRFDADVEIEAQWPSALVLLEGDAPPRPIDIPCTHATRRPGMLTALRALFRRS